jgi:hypothetical protein
MYDPENENIRTFNAIDNHLFAHGKAPRSCTEFPVTGTPFMRKVGQKTESVANGVHQPRGDLHTAAFPCDIEPDVVKVGFGPWRYTESH